MRKTDFAAQPLVVQLLARVWVVVEFVVEVVVDSSRWHARWPWFVVRIIGGAAAAGCQ